MCRLQEISGIETALAVDELFALKDAGGRTEGRWPVFELQRTLQLFLQYRHRNISVAGLPSR